MYKDMRTQISLLGISPKIKVEHQSQLMCEEFADNPTGRTTGASLVPGAHALRNGETSSCRILASQAWRTLAE